MIRAFIIMIVCLLLLTAVLISPSLATNRSDESDWRSKVVPLVLAETEPSQNRNAVTYPETDFLVILAEQADVSAADSLSAKEEKGRTVYETLTAVARRTQPALLQQLAAGVPYRRYWLVNMIAMRGDRQLVEQMARRDDVAAIQANPRVALELVPTSEADMQRALAAIEWNIDLVGAPAVWAAGVTGEGVVIGGQDTGYDWDHPGLINAYRGWDGSSADHNYNWHDAIHSGGGICGADAAEPCDDHGHGTHTMGTMVGNDLDPSDPAWPAGADHVVGMAPGAEWIGCRNMSVGVGSPSTYIECYEFFVAPYPVGGDPITDGDPTKAPHVINNSWSCPIGDPPVGEGCEEDTLLTAVQNVVAAGIVTVHAAGNRGICNPGGKVDAPAATFDESFSVGATTGSDTIASFSSRGPSTFDGGLKPDISAPGSGILSTTRGGGYGFNSGTSMAAPHVAGLVGLIVSARPDLAGRVAEIETLIEQTAVPLITNEGCGGDGPTDVPNHTYGYGRIDARTGVGTVLTPTLQVHKGAPAAILTGEHITYTLTVDYLHPITPTNNVVLTDVIPLQTQLVTATMPFAFDGSTVSWQRPLLVENETWEVQLVVSTIVSDTALVENLDYGVMSDEAVFVAGEPVATVIGLDKYHYFPFVRQD